MSKRLQVLLPEEEYRVLARTARKRKMTIAKLVRESLRLTLARSRPESSEEKIARILRFSRFSGPTGNIENLLAEIERGRHES